MSLILDMTAGRRAMWVNPKHPLTTFVDVRPEVDPGVCCDAGALPFPDGHFGLVVFDPPHGNLGQNSAMGRRYGSLTHAQIKAMVSRSGTEAHRVTRPGSLMVVKWSDRDLGVREIIKLLPRWEPLFGHALSSHATRNHYVHWALMARIP